MRVQEPVYPSLNTQSKALVNFRTEYNYFEYFPFPVLTFWINVFLDIFEIEIGFQGIYINVFILNLYLIY